MYALPNSSHLFLISALTTGVPNSFVGAPLASSIASSRPLPIAPAVQCSAVQRIGRVCSHPGRIQAVGCPVLMCCRSSMWCVSVGKAAVTCRAIEQHRLQCRGCT
jgi:hypothetical protein